MPLRTRVTLAALLLAAAPLAGCDDFTRQPPSPAASGSAAVASDGEEAHRLARAAADAALAAAKTCYIDAPTFDDAADVCPIDEPKVKALSDSAAALATFAREHAKETSKETAAFSETVSQFAAWMKQGFEHKRTRGTLRLFQDVADRWNEYQPREPIPVDPVEEFRLGGFGSKGYVMKPVKKTAGRVVWKSCYDGPCLWESHW
jgi:hypothetical protein